MVDNPNFLERRSAKMSEAWNIKNDRWDHHFENPAEPISPGIQNRKGYQSLLRTHSESTPILDPQAPADIEKPQFLKEKRSAPKSQRQAPVDPEILRRVAWEIGEKKAAAQYAPQANHV